MREINRMSSRSQTAHTDITSYYIPIIRSSTKLRSSASKNPSPFRTRTLRPLDCIGLRAIVVYTFKIILPKTKITPWCKQAFTNFETVYSFIVALSITCVVFGRFYAHSSLPCVYVYGFIGQQQQHKKSEFFKCVRWCAGLPKRHVSPNISSRYVRIYIYDRLCRVVRTESTWFFKTFTISLTLYMYIFHTTCCYEERRQKLLFSIPNYIIQ